jgi:hypothetical protein
MSKCLCSETRHKHGNPCGKEADSTATDKLCKECHDKKANEFASTQPKK